MNADISHCLFTLEVKEDPRLGSWSVLQHILETGDDIRGVLLWYLDFHIDGRYWGQPLN